MSDNKAKFEEQDAAQTAQDAADYAARRAPVLKKAPTKGDRRMVDELIKTLRAAGDESNKKLGLK